MKYVSLEHSIRSIMESSRQTIKAVARPEDNRKELENVPRENSKDTSAFTRMQEIKNKIVDEEYLPELTLEEVEELHDLVTNLLSEKKKKSKIGIKPEEPDAPMGTKETPVVVNPQVATEAKDPREYDYEGDMAISQIKSIMNHSKQLLDMLDPNTNLPEWVQSKITLSKDYIQTAADYMSTEMKEGYVSLAQQKAVWATRKDGGKGHPDNKKKKTNEEVIEEEIDKNLHRNLLANHDYHIGVENSKKNPDPNVLRDHERAANYHRKALETNNPHIARDAISLSSKALKIDTEHHRSLMAKHDHHIEVENSKKNPDPNVLDAHERARNYHSKALETNNPHIARDAISLSNKALKNEEVELDETSKFYQKVQTNMLHPNQKKLDKNKNGKLDADDFKKLRGEEVEFSEAELAHFNDVIEGRGRPKKSEDNPNTASGRDPRQHIQVIAGQAAGGRNIDFTHNNGDKTTITPSMGRKITDHLNSLKPADRQAAVNKMHASAGGLKLSEDLEQIDEFQGTIKKAATSSSMMSKATAEKGKTQNKQTSILIKQKQDAQKREFAKRQQTAQTASQRSAIKT